VSCRKAPARSETGSIDRQTIAVSARVGGGGKGQAAEAARVESNVAANVAALAPQTSAGQWWAHLDFTRMDPDRTILRNQIENRMETL
jgi:hypothetical protein